MCEFKIELKGEATKPTAVIVKTEYTTTSDGFEAVVTVAKHRKTEPYVSNIACSVGEQHLQRFQFWHELQVKVLNIHNNTENDETDRI